MIAIKLNAGNTPNGNPQRVFVILGENGIIDTIDEGYLSHGALHAKYPTLNVVAEFPTTKTEYRNLLKMGKQ